MVWNSDTHDCSAAPDFEFQAGSKAMTAAGKELQTKQMAAELSSLYSIERLLKSQILREKVSFP